MVLVMLACAPPELAPSLDLRNDPMLKEVPASATVLGGGDLAALWASPTAELLRAEGILRPDALKGLPRVGASRLGCGDGGCVIVADGDFSSYDMNNVSLVAPDLQVQMSERQLSLRPVRGKAMAVEVIGHRARGGDLEAGSGFDPLSLGDEVPAGDTWLLVREPLRMRDQAAARLRAEETEEGEEAAALLEQVPEGTLASVRSAAWSLDSGAEVLIGRLVAVDAAAAQGFEALARMQLAALSLAPDPRLAAMARNADVRRVDNVLEIEVRP